MKDRAVKPSPDRYRYDSKGNYIESIERKGGWDDYEIREALSTLTRAEKIRKNKPLMAAVKKEARKQLDAAARTANSL
ncbi:MAG TPA: hypothetical protein VFE72_08800 [Lysobacter sp.]|nr:hypothetical protein [Lysobacter sp.]